MTHRFFIAFVILVGFAASSLAQYNQDYGSFQGIADENAAGYYEDQRPRPRQPRYHERQSSYQQADYDPGYQEQYYDEPRRGYDSYNDDYYSHQSDGGYCGDCGYEDCYGDCQPRFPRVRQFLDRRERRRPLRRFRNRSFRDSYFDDCGEFDSCRRGPFYLSGFGGFTSIDNFLRRTDVDDGDANLQTVSRIGARVVDGGGGGMSIGRYVHPRGRAEFEFTYRDAGINQVFTNTTERDITNGASGNQIVTAQTFDDATGFLKVTSGIYNVLFDFERRQVGCAHLYAGGGVGVIYVDGTFSTATNDYAVDSSGFAYQGIMGVTYAMRPGFDLFTEYRYTGSQNISVDDVTGNIPLGNFRLDAHNVMFGFRVYR